MVGMYRYRYRYGAWALTTGMRDWYCIYIWQGLSGWIQVNGMDVGKWRIVSNSGYHRVSTWNMSLETNYIWVSDFQTQIASTDAIVFKILVVILNHGHAYGVWSWSAASFCASLRRSGLSAKRMWLGSSILVVSWTNGFSAQLHWAYYDQMILFDTREQLSR